MTSVPSRSKGRNLSVEHAPGNRPADGNFAPILDGAKSAHGTAVDLPEVLADWFLARAHPTGSVWLWTGTFDPARLRSTPGRAPLDRVGHRGAIDALKGWHRTVLAYAPEADTLVGVEAHKSGARHAHAAVVTDPGFRFEWASRAWFNDHGYNVWEPADRATAAARYAAKYVGKELGVWDAAFAGSRIQL